MPGRKFSAGSQYRYGFNGKENDNEVKGEGNQQDYGFRIYDPRLSRFLSVDPLTISYPWYTPYQFAGNKPILFIDLDGLEEGPSARYQPWIEFGIGVFEGFLGLNEESPRLSTFGTEYERFRLEAWSEQENARINAKSIEENGIINWGVDKAGTLVGNLTEVIVNSTPREKGQYTGMVLAIIVPGSGEVKLAMVAKKTQALTKTTKGLVKSIDEISEIASKSVDNGVTTSTVQKLKNADAIAEGRKFEADELAKTISSGKNTTGRNRLVPQNGKGNVKRNRTDTDQLIKNDDGTFSIVETKLSSTTRQSSGQKAAQKNTTSGSGIFEIRNNQPSQGLKKGDKIQVRDYTRKNKHE